MSTLATVAALEAATAGPLAEADAATLAALAAGFDAKDAPTPEALAEWWPECPDAVKRKRWNGCGRWRESPNRTHPRSLSTGADSRFTRGASFWTARRWKAPTCSAAGPSIRARHGPPVRG